MERQRHPRAAVPHFADAQCGLRDYASSDESMRYCLTACVAGAGSSSDMNAAPSIGPGAVAAPLCTITATASTPSVLKSATGMLHVADWPFHTPSRTQRRTTL